MAAARHNLGSVTVFLLSALLVTSVCGQHGLDLSSLSIEAWGENAQWHKIGLMVNVESIDVFAYCVVYNPGDQIVLDTRTAEVEWFEPQRFGTWSTTLPADMLYAGEYLILVVFTDETTGTRRVDVPGHLFSSATPSGYGLAEWWVPEGGGLPQPAFRWDTFQSPEFDPPSEEASQRIAVNNLWGVCVWSAPVPIDVTEAQYNFDGSASPGYETLSPDSYGSHLSVTEFQTYWSYTLDELDCYSTARGSWTFLGFVVYPRGDLNCDGAVNAFDIDPFVLALTAESAYVETFPHCMIALADCNADGFVDAFDIDAFVELLTGG